VTSDDKPFKGMHHDRQSNVTRRDAMKGGVGAASLAAIAPVVLHTVAATTPTFAQDGQEPLGGQPPKGATPSIKDFDYQIKYHRAFEAVLWNMPAIAIYSFRRAAFSDLGMKDNDIIAYSATATPKLEAITANSSTPYIAAYADLQRVRLSWNCLRLGRTAVFMVRSSMHGSLRSPMSVRQVSIAAKAASFFSRHPTTRTRSQTVIRRSHRQTIASILRFAPLLRRARPKRMPMPTLNGCGCITSARQAILQNRSSLILQITVIRRCRSTTNVILKTCTRL
jgi:hypothetical protein